MWKTRLWKTDAFFLISFFMITEARNFDKWFLRSDLCIGSVMLKTLPPTHGVSLAFPSTKRCGCAQKNEKICILFCIKFQ